MSAIMTGISATDVAKGLSIFEIDESLAALVEAAEEDAEANNGEPRSHRHQHQPPDRGKFDWTTWLCGYVRQLHHHRCPGGDWR